MTDYYVDGLIGDDSYNGLSPTVGSSPVTSPETGPLATIQAAVDKLSDGITQDTIYIKNSVTYNEQVTFNFTVSGPTLTAPHFIIGYGTTINDGERITIDGQSTRTHCIELTNQTVDYQCHFFNINCINATSDGLTTNNGRICLFINCGFNNNGGNGLTGSRTHKMAYCEALNNGNRGISVGTSLYMAGCVIGGNTSNDQVFADSMVNVYKNVVYGGVMNVQAGNGAFANTIDADGFSGATGGIDVASTTQLMLFDNLIYNVNIGMELSTTGWWWLGVIGNNMFIDVTTPVTGWPDNIPVRRNHIENPSPNVPGFVDQPNNNYQITDASYAKGSGLVPGHDV